MNKWLCAFLLGFCYATFAHGESFLTASSFPTTFNDLSFDSRMQFKFDDYELYRPEYDTDGFCIKNCAYPGLNIKYETEQSMLDTQSALNRSRQYETRKQNLPVDTKSIVSVVQSKNFCYNRNSDIPLEQKVPWGEPLKNSPRISSSYGERTLEGKRSFHDGIDYAVESGTPVYTTADGRVARVINDSVCGKGVRIQHEDGTQTIYCHLNKQMVQVGDNVGAGCQIGESGNTGHSTGAHLHYGMRDSNNNKINPSYYTFRDK